MINHPALRTLVCAVITGAALGGCSLGTIGGIMSPEASEQPATTATASARGTGLPQPNMMGRWLLASQGAAPCTMNFAGAAGGREGTIAPEGGCPGKFFTSRQWSFEQNAVIIRNHAGEMLAQLQVTEPARLVGQTATGEPVSLTR
jgi:hypothetical protein